MASSSAAAAATTGHRRAKRGGDCFRESQQNEEEDASGGNDDAQSGNPLSKFCSLTHFTKIPISSSLDLDWIHKTISLVWSISRCHKLSAIWMEFHV